MNQEKLRNSLWVSKEEWYGIKVYGCDGDVGLLAYSNERSIKYPIELTITAKMPERKREFTEGELREFLNSRETISETIEEAFKEGE